MDASQQYQGKTLRAPAEWWERVIAWAGANGFKESEAIRELCIRQLDAEALGRARVQAGPSLDEIRAAMVDVLAAHQSTTTLTPRPMPALSLPAEVVDQLTEIENAARLAHLAAEAALQAVAYQRDHPNMVADEVVRHARRAAHHRLNPTGGAA